jgi:hypothetical protein
MRVRLPFFRPSLGFEYQPTSGRANRGHRMSGCIPLQLPLESKKADLMELAPEPKQNLAEP